MALPSNDHHVHSDGYTSDRGEPDQARMLDEIADEIEQIPGVLNVWPDDEMVEIDYDGSSDTYVEIEETIDEWACTVEPVRDDWCEVWPDQA